jgi:hypothetical protein
VAVAVLQVDATVFDSHHRTDVAGLDVLDYQAQLRRVFGRARLAPTRREDIGSIAIHHPAILGSLAAKRRCGALPCRNLVKH